jgi:hypothetical protein
MSQDLKDLIPTTTTTIDLMKKSISSNTHLKTWGVKLG